MEVERLPWQVVVDILSRLHDVSDLGRCRMASKYLLHLSPHVHTIRFYCTYNRFLKTRSIQNTEYRITPFKDIVKNTLLKLGQIQSLRFDIEESMQRLSYEEEDGEFSDYWLTDVDFVLEWLSHVAESLRCLSITDFWQQSCWRCTNVMPVISIHCKALHTLELRNAWLSVEGMRKMGTLTNLTLEFIRLNDESLTVVNECFPALERLNLINVGGLKDPCIHLPQLRFCHWTVSNSPVSLTLKVCRLEELKLQCFCPERLSIEAPLLASLQLSMEKPGKLFKAEGMLNLRRLVVHSFELFSLIWLLSGREFVEKLLLELPVLAFDEEGHCDGFGRKPSQMAGLEELGRAFPVLSTLIIGPGAWYTLEYGLYREGDIGCGSGWKCLKKLVLHVVLLKVESTYILMSRIFVLCPALCNVEVYFHWDGIPDAQSLLISKCQSDFPYFSWKWGVWRERLHGF
eukprot:Gb_14075 [translate_table: standard]